jgi:hypothetical protein
MKIGITLTLLATLCAFGCESKKEEAPPAVTAAPAPPPPATPALTPAAMAKPTQPDLKVAQEAAALANKIEQTPADAEKILSAAGTSREGFVEKLYVIAEDPALSAEYARLYQPKQPG